MLFHPFSVFGPTIRAGVLQVDVAAGVDFPVQTMNQVHGADFAVVEALSEDLESVDALITEKKGVALMVKTADCIPMVLADEETGVAAAVHLGWRSLTKDLLLKTVKQMVKMGANKERIRAGIGPSLGLCCSEFSDPFKEIPKKYHFAIDGKMVDLNGICDFQLERAGILKENVERMDICTKDHLDWFSWRRDGDERRFGTLIELLDGKYFIHMTISEQVEVSSSLG